MTIYVMCQWSLMMNRACVLISMEVVRIEIIQVLGGISIIIGYDDGTCEVKQITFYNPIDSNHEIIIKIKG